MELRRRLVIQDSATILMLIAFFALTIVVSCLSIYQVSADPSPVMFYSDAKLLRQRLTCSSDEVEEFLQAFNGQPQSTRLRIIGKSADDDDAGGILSSLGMRQIRRQSRNMMSRREHGTSGDDDILFDVSLDLTPFITGNGRLRSDEDVAQLVSFMNNPNPLSVLSLQKQVEWANWEDIATNVKQRLRTLGFQGEVEVRLEAEEEVIVYRNHPWQNFVRSRITQVLVIISIVGGLVWIPYLWVRMKKIRIESRFQISLDLARYWDLLAGGLHAQDGFRCT